jgi:trk system potassium uptake protein TrkA
MYVLIANEIPLGRQVASALVTHGHEVSYVDRDIDYCNMISTELGCLVVHGETTNMRVLHSAGIERADALITLHEKDIRNILVGLFGRQFGVRQIVALLRQEHYRAAYELAGIETVLSAFGFLLNELLIAVEAPTIRRVMALGDGHIELAEIDLSEDCPLIGETIDSLYFHDDFPRGAMVLGILHQNEQKLSLPRDKPTLRIGDEVLVVGTPADVQRIAGIMGQRRRRFLR